MKLIMTNVRVLSIPELEQLLSASSSVAFAAMDKAEAYDWIAGTLLASLP